MGTSADCSFPVNFRDVHYIAALYTSNFEAVNKKLSGTGLKTALVINNKPVVALGLIQYKDSDLGSYNEVIIAIPVIPTNCSSGFMNWLDLYAPLDTRKGGQYILHIPVTTQKSVDAGRGCWGYPKTLLPIEHDFTASKTTTRIKDASGNNNIITIQGSNGIGIPIPSMNLMTYSFLDHDLIKTKVDVNANMKWKPFSNIKISVEDSSHPMAKDIIELDICSKNPVFTIESTKFKAKFNAGQKIG